jgi:integrase/recombinase XerD
MYTIDRDQSDQPLFQVDTGGQMDKDNVLHLLYAIGERGKVHDVHPHRFRHTFAIQYLRNGGDVFTLQRLLGHTSLEMTRRYLDLAMIDDERAHKKASPVDNWRL